eukprot:gene13753-13872_t
MQLPAYRALLDSGIGTAATGQAPPAASASPKQPSGVGCSSVSTRKASSALAALQRALVEDFVLYEEASAARQHVVGILVAIEQGDVAAGQRLMAHSCTELIAATAPAADPNRLAAFMAPAGSPAAAAVIENVAAGTDSGVGDGSVNRMAAQAACRYLNSSKGISKLLGMASSSRAALEPAQVQQQQHHARIGRAGVEMLLQDLPKSEEAAAAPSSVSSAAGMPEAGVAADAPDSHELEVAVAELLQLPELLQGLQGSQFPQVQGVQPAPLAAIQEVGS